MTAADPRAAMLCDMAECAYRLAMAFGREAERAQDLATKLKWTDVFQRCFFAVRVSTALELRLKHEPKEAREAASDREALADRDPPERPERYSERDRETERASFPILIRALEGVAADAAALPGPEPAELPTLRDLLARVKAEPPPAPRPKPPGTLRSRLTGATALALAPPPSGVTAAATRRATGPPP